MGEGFPYLYKILQMCEMFQCLPSQLMEEDSDIIHRLYYLKVVETQQQKQMAESRVSARGAGKKKFR